MKCWLPGRGVVTFSIKAISFCPHACSLPDFCFLVEHFWGWKSVAVTLVAVCRVKGVSQQAQYLKCLSEVLM